MATKNYYVWSWLDDDGQVIFLGKGRKARGAHPWDAMWKERGYADNPMYGSTLNKYLRTQHEQPARGRVLGADPNGMNEHAADEIYTLNRNELIKAGAKLLSTRPAGSYRTGGGKRKAVVADGLFFPSVREAARFYKIDLTTVIRRLRSPNFPDWFYKQ